MDPTLTRIKRAVLAGNYRLTDKADIELERDGLGLSDVEESILQATRIEKNLKSTSSRRSVSREYLHIIISENFDGIEVYTKGKLECEYGVDIYYVFISAKRSQRS